MEKRFFKDDLTDTWFKIGIAFAIVFAIAAPALYIFEDYLTDGGIICAFYTLTKIYCPGCGGTRSVEFLLHGHLFKSFLYNPFVPYYAIDYVVFMINTILVKTTKKLGFTGFPVTGSIYVGIGVLLGQWIIRNIIFKIWGITCL